MREDDLDFEGMQKDLQALKELFVEYVESSTQSHAAEDRSLADSLAMIGLRERILRTLAAIDECLDTVDEITRAGGMEPFLRAHIPAGGAGRPGSGKRA